MGVQRVPSPLDVLPQLPHGLAPAGMQHLEKSKPQPTFELLGPQAPGLSFAQSAGGAEGR